jgi:hypothetical protein
MEQSHVRRIFSIISCLTLFFLSACSASSQENESIRAENCALIADWNVYINDPSSDYYQGNLNTYDTYTELESRLWGKLKTGDKSYDALVELRKLDYSQNYFKAPQMGEVVTEQNSEDFRVEDDLYDDDASWKIIEKVGASCPAFSREYLAEMFASALNMRD